MADTAPQAPSRIFISYRREDSSGHVLALLPALRRHFGADRIFKDTDNIPPGADFVKFIRRELESCSVLLAIIGREWLTIQDPRVKRPRLDNPDDFLRVEVATALKNEHTRVIPVLVERSSMPAQEDLPSDLAELSYRNAVELSDARWESDVQLLIQAIERATAAAPAPTDSGLHQRQDLLDLQKRRAREIAGHVAAAQEAFDATDYDGAIWACEKALLLNPEHTEALEILDRARKAIDEQKISGWLNEARDLLTRSEIGEASDLIDQALAVDHTSEAALELRKVMLDLRRERERERERAKAVRAATDRARTSLDDGAFDDAVRHAEDALALDSEAAEAQEIRSKALAILDDRRRQRDQKRRAQQTVAEARAKFAAGNQDAAVRLLREFSPPHELVTNALQELEKDSEAKARQATAAAANARRLADAKLAEAAAKFRAQDYPAARQLVDAARNHDPQHPELASWVRRIDEAVEHAAAAARREESIRKAMAEANTSFESGDMDSALRSAEAALALNAALGEARTLRDKAQAAIAARQARDHQERFAAETSRRARDLFKSRDYTTALRLLEGFTPAHPLVTQALDELRDEFRQIEERRRHEEAEAARLRTEAERTAAERQRAESIRQILARGRASLDRKDFGAALRDADEILGTDAQSIDGCELRAAAEALQQRLEREEQERVTVAAAESARVEAERAAAARRKTEREQKERERAAAQAAEKARRDAVEAEEARPLAEARARAAQEHEQERELTAAVPGADQQPVAMHPDRPVSRRTGLAAAALAVILAVVVGTWYFNRPSPSPTAPPSATPPSTTPAPGTAVVNPGAAEKPTVPAPGAADPVPTGTTAEPPASSPASKTPSEAEVRRQRIEKLRSTATGQFRAGQRPQALTTAGEGLKLDADDPELNALVDSLLDDAERTSTRAKDKATSAGAPTAARDTFGQGLKLEDDAEQSRAAGRKDLATRSFWRAADRFDLAARQAENHANEMARLKQREEERRTSKPPPIDPSREKPSTQPAPQPTVQTPPAGKQPGTIVEEDKTAVNRPPTTTAKPPAAEPPRVPVRSRAEEQERVLAVMDAYEAAYDNLDFAGVKAVYPSVEESLAQQFKQFKFYRLEMLREKIDVSADAKSAVAIYRLFHTFEEKVGGVQNFNRRHQFTFEKRGDAWIITRIGKG